MICKVNFRHGLLLLFFFIFKRVHHKVHGFVKFVELFLTFNLHDFFHDV